MAAKSADSCGLIGILGTTVTVAFAGRTFWAARATDSQSGGWSEVSRRPDVAAERRFGLGFGSVFLFRRGGKLEYI
jgi:hypothetical protein